MSENFPGLKKENTKTRNIIPIPKTGRIRELIKNLSKLGQKLDKDTITIIDEQHVPELLEAHIPVSKIDGKYYADFSDVDLNVIEDQKHVPYVPEESVEMEIRREMDRIDRETLEKTLLQWYDQVIFDDENEQIFVRGKNGLLSSVSFDDVERLIQMNDEYDQNEVSEEIPIESIKSIDGVTEQARDEAAALMNRLREKENSIHDLIEEKSEDPDRLPILMNVVEDENLYRSREIPVLTDVLEKGPVSPASVRALRKYFDTVRYIPDTKTFALRNARGEWISIPAHTNAVFQKIKDMERAMLSSQEKSQDEIDTDPAPLTNAVILTPSEHARVPNVEVALEYARASARKSLAELSEEVQNREKSTGEKEVIADESFTESEITDSVVGKLYGEVPQLEETTLEDTPIPSRPKKMSKEEQQKYTASLRERKTQEGDSPGEPPLSPEIPSSGGDDSSKQEKSHLNNAESVAYLKEVQEMRKQQREATEQQRPEAETPISSNQYWEGLNQHISPDNYNRYGFDSDQTDAYWRAQQLTMHPQWANLSNEELLKKFEESRSDGEDTSPSEDVSVESQPAPAHSLETVSAPEGGDDFRTEIQAEAGDPSAEGMQTHVDIELPPVSLAKEDLPVLTDVVSLPTVNTEHTPDPVIVRSEQSAPSRPNETIQKDIAFLQKVKSEVSSGSREFINFAIQNDPNFKKEYEAAGGSREAFAHMWIEKKLSALKAEGKEVASQSGNFFDERFEKQFGIKKEELSKIEGFEKLSNGQQMLVYESLEEYADEQSRGKAAAMWASVRSAMGQNVEKAPRKDAKGISEYGEFLSKLILSTALHGPKVYLEKGLLISGFVDTENGEVPHVQPDLIGIKHLDRVVRLEQKEVADNLNEAAHAFAHIPASWQEDGNGVHGKSESRITTFFKEKLFQTESRNHYREYEAGQKVYEIAKKAFAEKLEATGVPREQIVRKLIEVDTKVNQLRFIDTNPEAAALIKSISNKTFWEKVGGAVKAGGVYAGLGTVGRTMTGEALHFLSGPAVAATLAGTRAWNKTAAEQRERDRKARMGTNDVSAGALNIVSATQMVKTREGKRDMGVSAKLERLVKEYQNLPDSIDPKERIRLLNQLKARTTYSQDKFNLNRIHFGDQKSFAVNQARFIEALASAQVLIAESGVNTESRLGNRLAQYLDYRDGAINDRRHAEARKKLYIASSIAAGMAGAGAYAAHEFIKSGMADQAVERIKGGAERVKDWFTWDKTNTPETAGSDMEGEVNSPVPLSEAQNESEKILTAENLESVREFDEPLTPSGTVPVENVGLEPEQPSSDAVTERVPASPPEDIDTQIEQRARAMEAKFISENIPPKEWGRIRDDDASTFIKRSLAKAAFLEKYTSSSLMKGQPTQAQMLGRFAQVLDGAKQYGIMPTKGETVESFTHRVFVANERIVEKENIMGLFGTSPEALPKNQMVPQSYDQSARGNSPTPKERAEVQKLFSDGQLRTLEKYATLEQKQRVVTNEWYKKGVEEMNALNKTRSFDISNSGEPVQFKDGLTHEGVLKDLTRGEVMPGIDAMNAQPGRVLEGHYIQNYLNGNVPKNMWVKARVMPAEEFIFGTMERGGPFRRSPALVGLGNVFRDIQQPPYNVFLRTGETTEVFMSRVFSVLAQADKQGTNTENMREFLREITTPTGRVRR